MRPHKKVLFLVPYPVHKAPSQRFRVELFFPLLDEQGINYTIQSFFDQRSWEVLYKEARYIPKILGVLKGFLRRFKMIVFDVHRFDFVFIHRETSPVGPPVFEWIIAKVWRKKIIYDFDDAIWISGSKNKIRNWFKAYWKIRFICRWSYKVSAGNEYLCDYAKKFNGSVVLMPTCVDTVLQHNRLKYQKTGKVAIGWTGSHSTLVYLDTLVPLLRQLAEQHQVEIIIICNRSPDFSFPGLTFIPWKEETEIEDLLKINIGIMPLTADKWSKGKCGFKLIQYMALGIPAVASPVGVNQSIIENQKNGFLCSNNNEWYQALTALIANSGMREQMGSLGREKIISSYSVLANSACFLRLFT